MHDVIEKDRNHWMRQIFLSGRGTLMELGLGPGQTSSFVIKLMVQSGVLQFNRQSEAEVAEFQRVQMFIGAVFAVFQSIFYVFAGMYGPIVTLGTANALLIAVQLSSASVMM